MQKTCLNLLVVTTLLSCFTATARADALDNWTTVQLKPNFNNDTYGMTSVAYGNGRYVVGGELGDGGIIETSEDGLNWTVRGDPDGNSFLAIYRITFGNGIFVAVGYDNYGTYGNLYNSTDGINWTAHLNPTVSIFNGVTYGNGLFVAVGDGVRPMDQPFNRTNRQIYTSPDGTTWTGRTSGSPVNSVNVLWDVAYGAGIFVAVDGAGHTHTSLNGINWIRRTTSGAGNSISYCNNRFILSSGPGTNLISTDGLTWSILTNDTTGTFGRVIYTNGIYIALSGTNIFTSNDSTNWVRRNFPTNAYLGDIALGPCNVIAVGVPTYYGSTAYISDPFVAVNLQSGPPPQLTVSGLQGRSYRIDYLDGFQSPTNNWQTLTTFTLTNSPLIWSDITATNSQRFYRAVLLP
jgi:hypothetical protein